MENLSQIETDDPELFAKVKKYFLSFEDLLSMPDHVMRTFWRNPEIDIDLLAKALKGIDADKNSSILEMLPKKKQAMFTPREKPMKKKWKELMDDGFECCRPYKHRDGTVSFYTRDPEGNQLEFICQD